MLDIILLSRSRSRYSRRLQLIIELIQTQRSANTYNHTRSEPNFRFRLNARPHIFNNM
ncbi:hypothetical protein GIB67_026839, partial [Kingdonia uniflora]